MYVIKQLELHTSALNKNNDIDTSTVYYNENGYSTSNTNVSYTSGNLTGYRFAIVCYFINGKGDTRRYTIAPIDYNVYTQLTINDSNSSYNSTVYIRNISLDHTSFKLGACYVSRPDTYSEFNGISILAIYKLSKKLNL